MASANTICKKLLGVKSAVVTGQDFYIDQDGVTHLRIHARPNRWHADDCPIWHLACSGLGRHPYAKKVTMQSRG